MRLTGLVGLVALALAGCGSGDKGGEDFTVKVHKSPNDVAEALSGLDFAAQEAIFPGFAVNTSRPSRNEIVYTMPAQDAPGGATGESVIHLKLEPVGSGATTIHAAVDVPPIRMMMGEANKQLSEEKVERELRKVLADLSSDRLKELLVAVAIASRGDLQAQVNTAKLDSENPDAVFWGMDPETGKERVPSYRSASADHEVSADDAADSDWGSNTQD